MRNKKLEIESRFRGGYTQHQQSNDAKETKDRDAKRETQRDKRVEVYDSQASKQLIQGNLGRQRRPLKRNVIMIKREI